MNARRLISRIASATLVSGAAALSVAAQVASPRRVVDITAPDGLVLKGTLFVSPTPGPAVLLLHQCDEQRKVWEPLGAPLARSGVTALSIDYRSYGESGAHRTRNFLPPNSAQ